MRLAQKDMSGFTVTISSFIASITSKELSIYMGSAFWHTKDPDYAFISIKIHASLHDVPPLSPPTPFADSADAIFSNN